MKEFSRYVMYNENRKETGDEGNGRKNIRCGLLQNELGFCEGLYGRRDFRRGRRYARI